MLVLLAVSLLLLGYVYVGYPALLQLLTRLRGVRQVRQADITPSVSFIISAYNEADVIRQKIENTLALDYPREMLEIVVISDASEDGTDDIVRAYASQRVRLARQSQRRGKTAGLNRTLPTVGGDIVVFSDANAMYQSDALRKLARNFADAEVGCVTGEARYVDGGRNAADVGERVYWDYEIQLKRLETALGSMVGGDGAIYAIRRSLWRELPENAINDFLNPLQIVAAGWRAVYEPEAICFEETAGAVRSEYRRRVRIVSRSWRAVFQAPGVLNPFRVGLFTWSLVSHKMLRWLSGLFVLCAVIGAVGSATNVFEQQPYLVIGILASALAFVTITPVGRRLSKLFGYFFIIYAASLIGVLKGSFGQVSGVWSTPRHTAPRRPSYVIAISPMLEVTLIGLFIGGAMLYRTVSPEFVATVVFWTSAVVLGYVYVGYPVVLAVLRAIAGRPVQRGDIQPPICVFIAANDEAAVIESKVQNTLALDYPADKLEVIVASDGSVDATNEIVRGFASRVKLLEFAPRRGKMAAINEGVKTVTSEIVIFSDANTFLQPDAARALVRNFADPRVGGVSGDVVLIGERAALGRSEDMYYRYERWIQRAESEVGSMIGADGALYAIRRDLFEPPDDDTILDDMAIPMGVLRTGHRVVFEPAARAFEQGSETAKEEFARKARVTAGAMQFLRRRASDVPLTSPQVMLSLLSHKILRWLSPMFGALTLLSSLALASSGLIYMAVAVAVGTVLVFGVAGCVPGLRRFGPVAVSHYFCLVQTAAGYGFVRGLTGRQSVLWKRFDRLHSPTARRSAA